MSSPIKKVNKEVKVLTTGHLDDHPIWKSAKDNNELVFAMKQRHTNLFYSDMAEEDYCMGLVAAWLEMRLQSKNFQHKDLIVNDPPKESAEYHKTYMELCENKHVNVIVAHGGKQDEFNLKTHIKNIFDKANLKVLRPGVEMSATAENWVKEIKKGKIIKASKCYVSLDYPSDSSHAVALEYLNPQLGFFDPEWGHFEFKDIDRFKDWMKKTSGLMDDEYCGAFTNIQFYWVV